MEGRFLYGIIPYDEEIELGPGVEDEEVYTIPAPSDEFDIAAVAHECPLEPYDTTDEEVVERWMSQYISILDSLMERFSEVTPFRFDTIIEGGDEGVRKFLEDNYTEIKEAFQRIKDRREYVVTINLEDEGSEDPEGKEGKSREVKSGKEYLMQKKSEKEKKEKHKEKKKELRNDFRGWIEAASYLVKDTERYSKDEILRVSLLLSEEEVNSVGDVLDEINSKENIEVDFSGPWPPFSFTELEIGEGKAEEKKMQET